MKRWEKEQQERESREYIQNIEKEQEILINGLYAAARTDYDGTVCFESSVLEAIVAAMYPDMWAELEKKFKTEEVKAE